jgi:hypothetical protein
MALVLALAGAACGDDDDDTEASTDETTTTTAAAAEESDPKVEITEPADGAAGMPSPVTVKMHATDFVIEPAGTVTEGHGHFHVMVDTPCVEAGQIIPMDATHNHYGKAQLEAPLELTRGEHTLCLQAGDGVHTALDLTHEIKITVR